MEHENGTTIENDWHLPLFVVSTLLFVTLWVSLLSSAYQHWSSLSSDAIWFVVLFPTPWIIMLKHRRNTAAMMVGLFAYGLLINAMRIIRL